MTGGSTREPSTPFSILVVCTGNICRSPLAEQLLIAQLSALGLNLLVRSAGTSAQAGAAMPPQAAAVSRRYGGSPQHHHALSLTAALVAEADLVLTATREHSHAVVQLHPRAARFTYTLAQFARLIDGLAAPPAAAMLAIPVASDSAPDEITADPTHSRLRMLVNEVAATRGFSPPPTNPDIDDIEDPYFQPAEVYDRVGVLIDSVVTRIAGYLALVRTVF